MATISTTYDVFISHSASDNDVAAEVAENLESAGLATFHGSRVLAGADASEAIWQALAESRAVIAIISPDTATHSMGLIEIGASAAWNKPVFVLINGPSSMKLPVALDAYPVYPLSRLEDVIRSIRTGFEPLTDEERGFLKRLYKEFDMPSDQLSRSPRALHDLTSQFKRKSHKQISGERLLWELLRMRKQGQLPRLQSRKSPA